MLFLFWFLQLPEGEKLLTNAIDELEYYAAYDPHVINCAIAYLIFKPTEIALTYGIETLFAFFARDRALAQEPNDGCYESEP